MEMEIIGPIKVKDGLFVGDEFSSQDLEFVVANKVSHIINCASRQVPNHWEPIGVRYLSLYWLDNDSQVLFDTRDDTFSLIFEFIEQAVSLGESVLIHSVRGQTRCICALTAYFMKKYRWTLFKTLEFLNSRRPDMDLRPVFVHQLAGLENRLLKLGLGPITSTWEDENLNDIEEHVIKNTYLNAQMAPFANYDDVETIEKSNRLNWADNHTDQKEKLVDIHHPSSKNPIEDGYAILRSCIKGAPQIEYRAPLLALKKETKHFRIRGDKINQGQAEKGVATSQDDLQKLAESLHHDIMKSMNPVKREYSPAGASKRRISPINVNVNRKKPNG